MRSQLLRPSGVTARVEASPGHSVRWRTLAGIVLIVVAGMAGIEGLTWALYPHLQAWEWCVVTISAAGVAAWFCAYFMMRIETRLLARHTDTESKLALERNLL